MAGIKKMTEHLLPPHLPVLITRLLFSFRVELEDNCRRGKKKATQVITWPSGFFLFFFTDNPIFYNYIWEFSRTPKLLITEGKFPQSLPLRLSLWLILDSPKAPPAPGLAAARLLSSQRKEEPNAAGV